METQASEWREGRRLGTSRSRIGLLAGEPLLLIAGIILVLYFARDILIPVALALTLNFFFTPAVAWLEKRRVGRMAAVSLVLAVACSAVAGVGWVVTSQLVRIAEALPKYQQNVRQKLDLINAANGTTFNRAITSIEQLDEEFTLGTAPNPSSNVLAPPSSFPAQVSVVPPRVGVFPYLRDNLFPIFKPFGLAGIVLVFTVYMLIKREELRNRLLLLAGMGHINIMSQAIDEAASRISRYLILQLTVNSIYGLLFGLGMFGVGIPNATLWGVIACIFRFVPYLGALLSAALPCALALAVFQSWWPPLLVILIYGVLEIIAANFVEPWLYGSHTGVSALALLVLAVVWGLIWGWAGLVLSTPLTVCLIVLGRYVPQFSFLHTLLGDEAELSPEAQFYERLLSMDQAEARAIAARFLKNRSLVELYDKVVLPALTLAENDRHKGVLDEAKANFLILSTNELVVELTDLPADTIAPGTSGAEALTSGGIGGRKPPVVCFSASDQADELAATMLAQLLERWDHSTLLLPSGSLSEEVLSRMAEAPETIICISAIPPLAFAHARATCLRVRKHLATNRIMVGLWGASDDPDDLRDRFGAARPEVVLTSLAGALAQVQEWERDSVSSTVFRR